MQVATPARSSVQTPAVPAPSTMPTPSESFTSEGDEVTVMVSMSPVAAVRAASPFAIVSVAAPNALAGTARAPIVATPSTARRIALVIPISLSPRLLQLVAFSPY